MGIGEGKGIEDWRLGLDQRSEIGDGKGIEIVDGILNIGIWAWGLKLWIGAQVFELGIEIGVWELRFKIGD